MCFNVYMACGLKCIDAVYTYRAHRVIVSQVILSLENIVRKKWGDIYELFKAPHVLK